MFRFVGVAFLLFIGSAHAIDSNEFQIYGTNAKGESFDIRPYGMHDFAVGDPDEPEGIHGNFYVLAKRKGEDTLELIGACKVTLTTTYAFSCEKGDRSFSGVTYVGQKIRKSDLKKNPDAKKIYREFIEKFEYGELAAFFRCKSGCSTAVPRWLILVWRGD